MASTQVITRFAPSPTGALHVGGARTALFSWAFARRHGGQFILRFEDTDQKRSSVESARGILRDLTWLGLDWDQGPAPGADDPFAQQVGERGPYCQSQRLALYNEQIERLLSSGAAYRPDGEDVVRFRMDAAVEFDDAVYGHVAVQAADLEDFVIRKSDGYPTFHLAVVVDDALMGVTHVIRGQEHLSNTPKHVALLDALGFDRPVYGHTPSIMNPDGSKMSKRDKAKAAREAAKLHINTAEDPNSWIQRLVESGRVAEQGHQPCGEDTITAFIDKKSDDIEVAELIANDLGLALPEIEVDDFRESGYLPAPLVNYLALLGWNPGGDVEDFGDDPWRFLAERFSLDRINKSNSRFDRQKLAAFNQDAIAALPAEAFAQRLRDYVSTHPHRATWETLIGDDARFALFAAAYQGRSRTLADPLTLGAFFVAEASEIDYDAKAVAKVLEKNDGDGYAALREIRPKLAALETWSADAIHGLIETFATETGRGMGKVAQPLRVALTGSTVSPSIDETLVILGQDETLRRVDRCISAGS